MQFIYIIGAQCTGKTTLVEAIRSHLTQNRPHIPVGIIRETARTTLQLHQFTREDIRPGGSRCLQLQKLIMEGQEAAERDMISQNLDFVIADRSGIDPLVHAQMYYGDAATTEMVESDTWRKLKVHMEKGIVVVCEPVQRWLMDDNIRLMPLDQEERDLMHESFLNMLDYHQLKHTVLPRSLLPLDERVEFALSSLDSSLTDLDGSNNQALSRSSSEVTPSAESI